MFVFSDTEKEEMIQKLVSNMPMLRKRLNLSQEELASIAGVSRQTINAIENNKYDPTLALAFRLAQVLGTTVDLLFTPSV